MRQRVIARLDELIHKYREVLQDGYYTVRDGRYVLPVRSDSHIRVPGIVLGSSASGHTLFIEPGAVMSLGNQLKVALADVEREEARVLAELSERARRECAAINDAIEACVDADVLLAMVRIADVMKGIAIPVEDGPVLDLRVARHPLLQLSGIPVVANDLCVECGKVLVISGPQRGRQDRGAQVPRARGVDGPDRGCPFRSQRARASGGSSRCSRTSGTTRASRAR
jgi:DNA mismatch repair protein MutS2